MSEFIGSRISLVSRSDIRYVGTLHEINSDTSTVALENVTSYGTEGRKNNADEEIAPSDSIYEYIVFRGSDVKDLRIEEAPAVKENKPPQVPNDPAILGSGSRPPAQAPPSRPTPQQTPQHQPPIGPQQQQGPPPQFPHSPYPPHFYPPPQWGRGGPGFPPMPYGAPPPGWFPPPGQGFPGGPMPPYGQFPPGPPGPPGQPFQQHPQPQPQQQSQQQAPKPSPIGPGAPKQPTPPGGPVVDKPIEKPIEPKSLAKPDAPAPATTQPQPQASTSAPKQPTPTAEPAVPVDEEQTKKPAPVPTGPAANKNIAPTKPKNNGRILPAIPLQSPATAKAPMQTPTAAAKPTPASASTANAAAALRDATQAATAAVAAAMAKLPPTSSQQTNGNDAVDNLTKKVNEMRTDAIRAPRQPGGGGFTQNQRGRGRGGARHETRKIEVPETDFDFQTANAKFNKEEVVKEVIEAPNGTPTEDAREAVKDESGPAGPSYNKTTSFFDNISSEIKDRQEANGARPGGREWRGEEQKKNMETFGQGSVDNGYRGGYRGRGRGRGGMRGRGYGGIRGRGGYRGRGEGQAAAQ